MSEVHEVKMRTLPHRMLSGSLMNCHANGVDSLVLKGAPGMVRVFVARPEHELWMEPGDKLPLGLHAHHCDLTLTPLFGRIRNVKTETRVGEGYRLFTRRLSTFHYVSPIAEGSGGFQRVGNRVQEFELRSCQLREPESMRARDRHTIIVDQGQPAAWIVSEGEEDPDYLPLTYSDADLTQYDLSGMYQPMTEERLAEDLELLAAHGVNL